MGSVWLRWTVTWWEIPNGSEFGALDGLFLGNLQINPGLAKWMVFWSKKSDGARIGELDGILRGNSNRW